MARLSELEQFLQEQVGEGERVSAGQFTLSREKALEKLAAFQLPRPGAWVLKVVQGAVASGACSLSIKQTSTDTEFHFQPGEPWTLDRVESAFYEPEVNEWSGLDSLKRGLWSVALHAMRPFRLTLPGIDQALIWTGREFRRVIAPTTKQLSLTVSHRTVHEGQSMPLLASLTAARYNAEVLEELTSRAYVCPIPLSIDRRRLDALQACPSHGFTGRSYPLQLGFAETEAPRWGIPPATFGGFTHSHPVNPDLAGILRPPEQIQSTSVACLLSAHIGRAHTGKRMGWQTVPAPSCLYWVRDGVVIDQDPIEISDMTVSCALFASAADLGTDLTGFKLRNDKIRSERLSQLCKAVLPLVQAASDSALKKCLAGLAREGEQSNQLLGNCLLAGGLLMLFVVPTVGYCLLGGGGLTRVMAGKDEQLAAITLLRDLPKLQSEWAYL